jgi:hypothetical protein
MIEPTSDQVEFFVRLAADFPTTDIARQMYEVQKAGPVTAGAQILRRAIAEILALRVMVRRMQQGN